MSEIVDHRRRGRARQVRLAVAGALTVGAMTVVPAAQAADSLASVRVHVRGADAALHTVSAAVGSGMSASGPLASLRNQLRVAGKDAAKLYRSAHHSQTQVGVVRAATAMIKLAAQENRDVTALLPLVGTAGQGDIAALVASAAQGREQDLSLVAPLVTKLSSTVQAQVAGVVAQLSSAGTGQVGQLAGGIAPGSIACPAVDAVSQVVATVVTSVPVDLTRAQSMLTFLPADAQTAYTAVLGGIPAQLSGLVSSLKAGFDCASTIPGAGLPNGPAAGIGSLVTAVTQLAQSLLGGFLPAIGAGQVPSPVAIPATLSGLLGQVTAVTPVVGGLFGGSSSGLPALGGILGGLPVVGGLSVLGGLPVLGGLLG